MKNIENDDISDLKDKNCLKLFYFTASWCGPCKRIKPLIEKLSEGLDESKIIFYQVDIESNETLSNQYNIRSVPTFLLFDSNNSLLDNCSGSDIKKIHALLKKHMK
uniref:Thioredoxin domain-containing protein n=1 Tax=viral metagenome TaxID=1070528 RepID=A0A6C0BUZ6_9ZZZZ